MKTVITSKLTRRCLILVVMILGLAYIASSDRYFQPAVAAICCEDCPGGGDAASAGFFCEYGGPDPTCQVDCALVSNGGATQTAIDKCNTCKNDCHQDVNNCYSHCVFCYSNGGPGGSCNGTEDCPVNYFCGAGNTCEHY